MLQVTDLTVEFGAVRAVDRVSLRVDPGEMLGLVGESGCGKSATALAVIGLLPSPGRVVSGSVVFESESLLDLDEGALRRIRGSRIGFVFQEPSAALNPSFTIGDQVAEVLSVHGQARGRDARQRTLELLDAVRLPDPERCARDYPHRLSGGMRQRAVIAAALACRPSLLIADEPTTALDLTTQAEILDLLGDMRRTLGLSMLFITHDLAIVAGRADRVAVMYAGRIVEEGPARRVLQSPAHPYTRGLLESVPGARPGTRLKAIEGSVPGPGSAPDGCAFEPRCRERLEACRTTEPSPSAAGPGHQASCLLLGEQPS